MIEDTWDESDILPDDFETDEDLIDFKPQKPKLMEVKAPSSYNHEGEHDHYLLCSALNNTLVHTRMLDTMCIYANFLNGQILIGTERYHNAYSKEKQADYEDSIWWDPRIKDYIVDWQVDLFGDGQVLFDAHLRQRATILNPLDIYTNTTKNPLRVIPSAKLHMTPTKRSVSQKEPCYLATTGTLTPYKYSDTKTGYRSSQAAKLGFLHVYRRPDGYFAFRQVEVDQDGSFFDLDHYVDHTGVHEHDDVSVLFYPDSHCETMPEEIFESQLELTDFLNPKTAVVGDLINWEHGHHRKPFDNYSHPVESLYDGLNMSRRFLRCLKIRVDDIQVLDSNHHYHVDIAIEKFLSKGETNAEYWQILTQLASLKLDNPSVTALQSYIETTETHDYFWTRPDEELVIDGVTQLHGHLGVDGARGTPSQFHALTKPVTHGHFHRGYRKDDVIGVGVAGYNENQGYANKGYTTWTVSACVQYSTGARQLLHYIGGQWY